MDRSPNSLVSFTSVGDLLKFLRRRARLSQRELSIAVGYSESHISRIENNERPIDPSSLLALFVPALDVQGEPETIARLIALCKEARPMPANSSTIPDMAYLSAESQPTSRNRLPAQLTSFIGRREEVAELRDLLADRETRLLTLTGAGGCGKTRLALQVGEAVGQAYTHGVWLVELAPLSDPRLLTQAIAGCFGLGEGTEESLYTSLTDFLRARHLLLLLDNCEHLVEATAQLVAALLRNCPQLQILATSRERLDLPWELLFRVQPLALPMGLPLGQPHRAIIAGFDAIRLFVERSRQARRSFTLTDQNADAVARICLRLDGIPLAIELAAAWTNLLTPEQIMARLERNFDLLTGHNRANPLRHQTLIAAIDWSYDQLSEKERVLLRRLSIFAGGWTVDAAERVAGDLRPLKEGEILNLLDQLVGKSLVVLGHEPDGSARFRLLETIREYTRKRLIMSGDEEQMRKRHLAFFVILAESAAENPNSPEYSRWLTILDQEQENVRSALEYTHTEQMVEEGLRLVVALAPFWRHRGDYSEGRQRLAAALECTSELSLLRAQAILNAGILAARQGDMTTARSLSEESLGFFHAWNAADWEAQALENLGWSWSNEDRGEATYYFQQSLVLYRAQRNPQHISRLLTTLAQMAREEQQLEEARSYLTQALEFTTPEGSAHILNGLAELASLDGDYTEAGRLMTESLHYLDNKGSKQELAWSYCGLAENCWHRGFFVEGEAYAEKSIAFFRELGSDSGLAIALHHQGLLLLAEDKPTQAAGILRESLRYCQSKRLHFMEARCLAGLAGVALAEGDALQAIRLLETADPQLTTMHRLLTPADRSFYSRLREDSQNRVRQLVKYSL